MALALAGAARAEEPPAESPLVFVAGPGWGMEPGVLTASSLSQLVGRYDQWLPGGAPKLLAIFGRAAKLLFLDVPLVGVEQLVIHEVFGHGARGREAGLDPSYTFRLVPPYSWLLDSADDYTGATSGAGTMHLERDLPMTTGGIEAQYLSAYWVNARMMERDGWFDYRDMLEYGIARLAYADRFVRDLAALESGNDVTSYVRGLQDRFNRWRPAERASIARRLRRAYWFNFVDTTFWLSAYHGAVTYLIGGERDARLPRLALGDVTLYASTRLHLSPFGAEHILDLFARRGDLLFAAYARGGSSGLASSWGGGARLFGLRAPWNARLGAELDVWDQPEILFDGRFVFERPNRLGASAGARVDVTLYAQLGIVAKLAYKTRGSVMGEPIGEGWYGFAGISLAP